MDFRTILCAAFTTGTVGAGSVFAQAITSETENAGSPMTEQPLFATIASAEGADLGTVRLGFSPSGLAIATIALTGIEPGPHAVHFHQTGSCEAPFNSAGGHLAADKEHGVLSPAGPHPGDMPNIDIPESGSVKITYFIPGLTTNLVQDEDGTSFIIHAAEDDYTSQPSGEAGGRLGCAVIAPAS